MNLKKAILALSLVCTFSVLASEGAGGHGGDPFEVYAQPFPDQQKLDDAIRLINSRIRASVYPEDFKAHVSSEIAALKATNKILFLESIVVIPGDGRSDGVRLPADYRRFTGLGAMTGERRGDAIYFSARGANQAPVDFARLLLHETIHHLVPSYLSSDEEFVDALAAALMEGRNDLRLQTAIRRGVYLRPGKIDPLQMWYALTTLGWEGSCRSMMDFNPEGQCGHDAKAHVYANAAHFRSLGDNLVGKDLATVLYAYAFHLIRYAGASAVAGSQPGVTYSDTVARNMRVIIREAGLEDRWSAYPELACRQRVRLFGRCSPANRLKVEDVF